MNNSPIGFFDSGVGGLSVYAKFREVLPNEDTIYFGDLKNLPYGNKTSEQLISFARNILNFFRQKGVKAVIIACNTSSALAYEIIKNEYDFKIYPIIQSCARVISAMDVNKIGVFATEGTVKSNAYQNEIKKYNPKVNVLEIACPNWVSIVEKVCNNINPEKDIELHMLEMLKFKPDKIILGCTHYPYLMNRLVNYAPKEIFIDPAKIFIDYIKSDMADILNLQERKGKEEFYVSANPEAFLCNAKLFYHIEELPKIY